MKKGMTLVEILVSLTILTIILGAIFSILTLQQTKATNVQATTVMQTDANIALSLLRWDLFMAGYGIGTDDPSIISGDAGNNGGADNITLYGAGLAFESDGANWSPVLVPVQNSSKIIVYRFSDLATHFSVGDELILVDQNKNLLDSGLVVAGTTWTTHTAGEITVPALELDIAPGVVSAGQGAIAFSPNLSTYFSGVTYTLNNNKQLLRGNEVFLENVEDIQFAFGVDLNDNGAIEEPNEWFDDLNSIPNYTPQLLYQHKFAIRSSFVVVTKQLLRDYQYTGGAITLENNTYTPTTYDLRRKREIVTAITWPRNLQF